MYSVICMYSIYDTFKTYFEVQKYHSICYLPNNKKAQWEFFPIRILYTANGTDKSVYRHIVEQRCNLIQQAPFFGVQRNGIILAYNIVRSIVQNIVISL
jgi:hypothetical protein